MAGMENGPFEDVFLIENGDFPASYVSLFTGVYVFSFHFGVIHGVIMLPT